MAVVEVVVVVVVVVIAAVVAAAAAGAAEAAAAMIVIPGTLAVMIVMGAGGPRLGAVGLGSGEGAHQPELAWSRRQMTLWPRGQGVGLLG